MNKRQVLTKSVASLFFILLITFCWIIFKGATSALNPEVEGKSNSHPHNSPQHPLFEGLQAGQTVLRRHQRQLVWVIAVDEKTQTQGLLLNGFLLDPNSGCNLDQPFCVLKASTAIDGVNVQFTSQEPSQLANKTPWFGGFVDPTSGELYDLFGRAYAMNKRQEILSLPVVEINYE